MRSLALFPSFFLLSFLPSFLFYYDYCPCAFTKSCWSFLALRYEESLQMTKSLTHSVGGDLPNTITEMWEPSRDFAFFRLPTSGVRSVVPLSRWLSFPFFSSWEC